MGGGFYHAAFTASFANFELDPIGVELPFFLFTAHRMVGYGQSIACQFHCFIDMALTIIRFEGEIEYKDIKAEKTHNGPGSFQIEPQADGKGNEADAGHGDLEAAGAQRAVRGQNG